MKKEFTIDKKELETVVKKFNIYEKIGWLDHIPETPGRFRVRDNGDGTWDLFWEEGEIIQEGTPQSAENFSHMEDGIYNNSVMIDMVWREMENLLIEWAINGGGSSQGMVGFFTADINSLKINDGHYDDIRGNADVYLTNVIENTLKESKGNFIEGKAIDFDEVD